MQTANYAPKWWHLGGNLQTILANWHASDWDNSFNREIINLPDGDQIALDYLPAKNPSALIILFHGLAGGSQNNQIGYISNYFHQLGYSIAIPHRRGCGKFSNKLARTFIVGESKEINTYLHILAGIFTHCQTFFACGISLGGLDLIKWLAENPNQQIIKSAATICAPLALAPVHNHLDNRFSLTNRIYTRYYLNCLKSIISAKLKKYPSLINKSNLAKIKKLSELDKQFTVPVHSLGSLQQYYDACYISEQMLNAINTDTTLIYANNDPIIRLRDFPQINKIQNSKLKCIITNQGGHASYTNSNWLGNTLNTVFSSQ